MHSMYENNYCVEKDLELMYSHSFLNTIVVIKMQCGLKGGLQPFLRDSIDKDPGSRVG